jgi:cysteine-rich repeat protein/predicted outer membrane repeat protein
MLRFCWILAGCLLLTACGDDDGGTNDNQNNNSLTAVCGNGQVEIGELCDEGSQNSDVAPDTCRTSCRDPYCGDGVVDTGEACDEGGANSDVIQGACRRNCELAHCGDSVRDDGEPCDDGNTVDGDGCASDCQVEPLWQCAGSPSICQCAIYRSGTTCGECVVYVSKDGTGIGPDGESWATAFADVQQGIDAAYDAGPGCDVWVARGTYHIYTGSETDTVTLRNGVGVYGGFSGVETTRVERDPNTHHTVLSGSAADNVTKQVFHVLTAWGTKDATLAGLIIMSGYAIGLNDNVDDRGGGLLAYSASILVTGCTFTLNYALWSGGGIYAFGGDGLQVTGCTFSGNLSGQHGGGMGCRQSSPTVTNCTFAGNKAVLNGGAIYNAFIFAATVTNCTFSGNTAPHGGGIFGEGFAFPTVTNSIFSGNSNGIQGDTPAATYSNVQGMTPIPGNVLINEDPLFLPVANPTGTWDTVTYDGLTSQTTMTTTGAPWAGVDLVGLFVQPDDADDRWVPIVGNTASSITVIGDVTSWAGGGGSDTFNLYDLHLQPSSPCVDTGDSSVAPTTDIEGFPRADGADADSVAQPDMGAYEWQP